MFSSVDSASRLTAEPRSPPAVSLSACRPFSVHPSAVLRGRLRLSNSRRALWKEAPWIRWLSGAISGLVALVIGIAGVSRNLAPACRTS